MTSMLYYQIQRGTTFNKNHQKRLTLHSKLYGLQLKSMVEKDLALFIELANKILQAEKETPVVKPIHPRTIFDRFDLDLPDKAISEQDFKNALEDILLHTPKTTSNHFFNQLSGGRNSKGMLGELLAVMLNSTMATYKVAGPQVGVEQIMVKKICEIIGYDPKKSLGTMAPGGSMTIFKAMLMARDFYDKESKNKGVTKQMTLYTSAESHYSVPKNAAFMGVGRENVRFVKTNEQGQMNPSHLEELITEDLALGKHPFYVNATCGTTVLSVVDPINEIADVSEKYHLWLHVDGAYLGTVIFSEKYNFLTNGLHRANSFSLNSHKLLNTPISTSFIVTKHPECLHNTFGIEADYLYQTSTDEHNLGKISLQCGRRNDALKMWCLWKSVGTKGLGDIIDHEFYLADVARNYVKNNPNYTLYSFENSIAVCFNYKDIPAKDLCTQLYRQGKLMVGYGSFRENEFIRLVMVNGGNSKNDILNFFKKLEEFADAAFPVSVDS